MMPFDEGQDRRLRDAFAEVPAEAAPTSECPPPERIWDALHGATPKHEAAAIILHTAACEHCAEAWRIAPRAAGEVPGVPAPVRPAWRSPWVWIPGAAAAALLSFGILTDVLPKLSLGEAPVEYRAGGADPIRPLTPDGTALDRDAFTLRWTPGPEGCRYQVRVLTEALDQIAGAYALDRPEFTVPAPALAQLPADTRLLWQIVVITPGESPRTSATFVVTLR